MNSLPDICRRPMTEPCVVTPTIFTEQVPHGRDVGPATHRPECAQFDVLQPVLLGGEGEKTLRAHGSVMNATGTSLPPEPGDKPTAHA